MIWTRDNLRDLVHEKLGIHKLIVVSHREPFIHHYAPAGIAWTRPASGLTVALGPVMSASGGTWIAAGEGEADREVVNGKNRIPVPPDDPRYTLRRVFLEREDEDAFYYGYANEGLWPLCHIVHVRPVFRKGDWEAYQKVNRLFAETVVDELAGDRGLVFVQDYHFALLSRYLKELRPDVVTAQFWHIPWPNPEALRVCPQAEDLLRGLLGNDILGFHTRYHGLNFLDAVDRFLEARVDRERLSVVKEGRETLVRPYPISIDFEAIGRLADSPEIRERVARIRADFRFKGRVLGVGIERIDYTKGILERFQAIDRFLERYPSHRGRIVFLQLGPISRIHIPRYQEYNDAIYHAMIGINEKWRTRGWVPIHLQKANLDLPEVVAHYRAADFCIVSALHDGMNLVAKEFAAARTDEEGVLILSRFAGSATELLSALLIHPFDLDGFADAIKAALDMPPEERTDRMRKMRLAVQENNVYRWAGKILSEMNKLA